MGLLDQERCWYSESKAMAERKKSMSWIGHRELTERWDGRLWKFKLSEIDEWVHAGGAGQDEPDEGKEHE